LRRSLNVAISEFAYLESFVNNNDALVMPL
jgi:hypothetical protein